MEIYTYRTYPVSSPNGASRYTVHLVGVNEKKYDDFYDGFRIVDSKGKEILLHSGYDPLSTVEYLTTVRDDKRPFVQIPLDDDSFALIFGGILYEYDDGAGQMIIVVVRGDRATIVFDNYAFAYKYTSSPDFSIEFTDDVYGLLDEHGLYTITEGTLKPHTKYKIWQEGNTLKYKTWK